MIKIKRRDPPSSLKQTESGNHYDSVDVRETLWEMQKTKCCYCERHISQSGQGAHIEHFRPKGVPKFVGLRNIWANLLLACPDCNGHKGEQFPERGGRPLLIDPTSGINPEKHITFTAGVHEFEVPGLILEYKKSARGRKTIDVIRLNHPDYHRALTKYLKLRLRPAVDRLEGAIGKNNANEIASARADFEKLLADGAEFAGFARAFARAQSFGDCGISIP